MIETGVKSGAPPFYLQEQPPLSVEQAQAVSAALEQLHQASQAMGMQGIHGMGMALPPGHSQHEQAMQLPLQHQVGSGVSGRASGELQGSGM